MFIDASAIIAMLADEAQGDSFADALAKVDIRLTSAVAVWEAVAGLVKTYTLSVPEARAKVDELRRDRENQALPDRRGRIGHRARSLRAFQERAPSGPPQHGRLLRLCLALWSHDTSLLFKGDDFDKTEHSVGALRSRL